MFAFFCLSSEEVWFQGKRILRVSKLRAFLLQELRHTAPLLTFQGLLAKSRLLDHVGINTKSVKMQ